MIFLSSLGAAAQSCPTLCDPLDCSPPGSSVHAISQARILEWVAISFSRGSSWPRDRTYVFCTGRWILYLWAHQGSPQRALGGIANSCEGVRGWSFSAGHFCHHTVLLNDSRRLCLARGIATKFCFRKYLQACSLYIGLFYFCCLHLSWVLNFYFILNLFLIGYNCFTMLC